MEHSWTELCRWVWHAAASHYQLNDSFFLLPRLMQMKGLWVLYAECPDLLHKKSIYVPLYSVPTLSYTRNPLYFFSHPPPKYYFYQRVALFCNILCMPPPLSNGIPSSESVLKSRGLSPLSSWNLELHDPFSDLTPTANKQQRLDIWLTFLNPNTIVP